MGLTFDHIAPFVRSLQSAYAHGFFRDPMEPHHALLQRSLALLAESDALFLSSHGLTAAWSDVGTEGAVGVLRAVSMARAARAPKSDISADDLEFFETIAAVEFLRCGRLGTAKAIVSNRSGERVISQRENLLRNIQSSLRFLCVFDLTALRKEHGSHLPPKEPLAVSDRESELVRLTSVSCMASIRHLADYLIEGKPDSRERATEWVNGAVRLADLTGNSSLALLIESYARCLRTLVQLSLHEIPTQLRLGAEGGDETRAWIRHRIANGKPVLMPTQVEALRETGGLEGQSLLVSLPTGGGKTLLAEAFILKVRSLGSGGPVFLLEPTRALCNEKRDEMEAALSWQGADIRVSMITGDIGASGKNEVEESDVIVCTPEKFDQLLRQDFFGRIPAGIIVDEFHSIRRDIRGLRLQLTVARVMEMGRGRLLFISAIVRGEDFHALAKWANSSNPFDSDWRPTPRVVGVAALEEGAANIEFSDGTTTNVKRIPGARRDKSSAVMAIATQYLKDDQVLYFSPSWRGWRYSNLLIQMGEKYAQFLPSMGYRNLPEADRLHGRLSRLVGEEHPLARLFKAGVAMHWGELPHVFRRIMEEGIRKKAVGLVIATSTLAEGVNLPIRTVLVPKLILGGREMEIGTFLNLAGRAGRPFYHSEGRVIVAAGDGGKNASKSNLDLATRIAAATRDDLEALVTAAVRGGREALAVKWDSHGSVLSTPLGPQTNDDEDEKQDETPGDLIADLEVFESVLLAMLHEGLVTHFLANDTFERYFFIGTESAEDRDAARFYLSLAQRRLIASGALTEGSGGLTVTDFGKIVYPTGLGPGSCVRIRDFLAKRQGALQKLSLSGREFTSQDSDDWKWSEALFELISIPWEAHRFRVHELEPQEKFMLRGWLAGIPTQDIAETTSGLEGDYVRAYQTLESRITPYAAWVLRAATHIAENDPQIEKPLGPALRLLARTLQYGHHDPTAQHLLSQDTSAEMLRDDVLAVFRSLGKNGTRRLLQGGVPERRVVEALRKAGRTTKVPEEEMVGTLAAAIHRSERAKGKRTSP